MTETPKYRFETARDHLFDMIEGHRRWEHLDERDDPAHIAEMIEDGDVEIDPTGSLIRMTAKGLAWAIARSDDWEDHRFPPNVPTMSVRRYAKHRRVPISAVRAECEGRIAFAMWGTLIDYEVADALWPREKTVTPDLASPHNSLRGSGGPLQGRRSRFSAGITIFTQGPGRVEDLASEPAPAHC